MKIKDLLRKIADRLPLILSILCILSFAATGFVFAKYVQDVDNDVSIRVNLSGSIELEILENDDGSYTIAHGEWSDIPAYVRFAVVVNWADKNGNLYYTQPKDYTVTAENCTKLDNYYYFNGYLPVGEVIDNLTVTLNNGATKPAEYPNFRVQILAEGIQCQPDTVVVNAWGADFDGTIWSKTNP